MGNNTAYSDAVQVDLGRISHEAARWWAALPSLLQALGGELQSPVLENDITSLHGQSVSGLNTLSSYGGLKHHRESKNC